MLRFYFLIFLFLGTLVLNAQEFKTNFYGATEGADYLPGHMAALPDGGIFIVGQTNRVDTGGYHVLLIRADSLGNRLWEKVYHPGQGTWVSVTKDGGCVVGGNSLRHVFGTKQGFVLKVNAQGEVEWTQFFPLGNHSEVEEVKPLSSGGFVLCGVVSQPDTTGQNVFWARLSDDGALMQYEEIIAENFEWSPSIIEAKGNKLALTWSAYPGEKVRYFNLNGTLIWEIDLFESGVFVGSRPGIIEGLVGDFWLTGMSESFPYQPLILRLSRQDGSIIKVIPSGPILNTQEPITALLGQDGSMIFYTRGPYHLIRLKFDKQGAELSRDSFLWSNNALQSVVMADANKAFLLRREGLFSHPGTISVQPVVYTGADFTFPQVWEFEHEHIITNEVLDSYCKGIKGGTYVLFWGDSKTGAPYSIGHYVMKVDDSGHKLGETYLGEYFGYPAIIGELAATPDGGVIVLIWGDKCWKLDADLNIEWAKTVQRGRLYAGPENDFYVVEGSSQPDKFDPIQVHHYGQNGDSVFTQNVYSRSQNYAFLGGVSQINSGPVLFGKKYGEDGISRNWVIYIGRDGKFVSEQLLDEAYSPLSFASQFIQTTDGSVLAASQNGNEIYFLRIKDGQVVWDSHFSGDGSDDFFVRMLSVEEVPCKGFVLAISGNPHQNNAPSNIPPSQQIIVLYHFDDTGESKAFFSYYPLPTPSSTDTSFIPGYTYRRWDNRLNEQTFDLVLETVHFPDTAAQAQPTGHLALLPNPSVFETCLEYHSETYGILEVALFNEAGQCIDHFYSAKTDRVWHQNYRSNAPAGIYFIRVRLGEQEWATQRWIKGY